MLIPLPEANGAAMQRALPGASSLLPEYRPDEVSLAYAERAAALVLEHLRHQLEKGQVDQKMLDSLGFWTQEDLLRFYQEWDRLRREAHRVLRGPLAARDGHLRARCQALEACELQELAYGPLAFQVGSRPESEGIQQ